METYTAKINHFIIQPSAKINSFCKVFATKHSPEKEKILGKLFGLIEIKTKNQHSLELADFIIEQIKNNYYYQKNIVADIQEMFEKAIYKTNLDFTQFATYNNIKINLQNLNIIIALIKNRNLYFTQIGKISAFLIYYQQQHNYQVLNILEESGGMENNETSPFKIFSHVTSGKINSLDFLFLGTTNILNYLSLEEIKKIITTNPIAEISKKFKENIGLLNKQELFAGLTISLDTEEPKKLLKTIPREFNFAAAATQDSMNQLISAEKATQKLLSPSIIGGIKKYAEYFKNIFNRYSKKVKDFSLKNKNDSVKLGVIKKIFLKFKYLIQNIRQILEKITAGSSKNQLIKWFKKFIQIIFNWLVTQFKKLPILRKIALFTFIILAILLIQNIIKANIKNKKEENVKTFNQIVTEINQKKDAAQASLIYQDERNARAMLLAAKELIKNMPKKYAKAPETINLKTEIQNELNKLLHEFIINEPVLITNFKNLDSQMTPAPLALKIEEDFYTQNHRNQAIYKLNLASRVIAALQIPEIESGNFYLGAVFSPEELLFLNDKQLLFSFDAARNKLTPARLNLAPQAKIAALSVFANRLYLLDAFNSQITRLRKTPQGFTESTPWLEDKTVDLKNAADFTVEGNMYILQNNGEIIKLNKGQKVEFANPMIDPPLKGPTKIKTEENSKYLYILDPPTKRIVVVDKTGQLIAQYSSLVFNELKDFAVSENEAKIYILNGSAVYGIPAEHLE